MEPLLSRAAFRDAVFARDGLSCVNCHAPAQDAHHILERRLFSDGGYYLSNGASLCGACHELAEMTVLSVDTLREKACIRTPVLPEHLYSDVTYDKWGNILLPNGTRLRGELFNDKSVQKILRAGGVLGQFTSYVKYPRTYHLPWSQGVTSDDRVHPNMDHFEGRQVVVTKKMDGENTSMYKDYIHARSIDGRNHPSRGWVKNLWSQLSQDIPDGWRVCGENLYAVHSIRYNDLPSYFLGFSVWDDANTCLGWDDTLEWLTLLGVQPVEELYRGDYNEALIRRLWTEADRDVLEGYVVRDAGPVKYQDFRKYFGKFVRSNHVSTDAHWMHGRRIEVNRLTSDTTSTSI